MNTSSKALRKERNLMKSQRKLNSQYGSRRKYIWFLIKFVSFVPFVVSNSSVLAEIHTSISSHRLVEKDEWVSKWKISNSTNEKIPFSNLSYLIMPSTFDILSERDVCGHLKEEKSKSNLISSETHENFPIRIRNISNWERAARWSGPRDKSRKNSTYKYTRAEHRAFTIGGRIMCVGGGKAITVKNEIQCNWSWPLKNNSRMAKEKII